MTVKKMVIMDRKYGVSLEMDTGQDREETFLDAKLFEALTVKPRWTRREWIDYTKNTMSFGMEPHDKAVIRISNQPKFTQYEFKDFVRPIGIAMLYGRKKQLALMTPALWTSGLRVTKPKIASLRLQASAEEV